MTRFLDGPAEGVTLLLKRAPFFLRVVRNPAGEWDALDQLTDTPAADETIVVYQIASEPMRMHICARGPKARSGWYAGADYRLAVDPPPDDIARYTNAWQGWANTEGPKRGFTP